MRYLAYILLLFVAIRPGLNAQEELLPLLGNPKLEKAKMNWDAKALKGSPALYLSLPFRDDFSEEGAVFPSPLRWADRYAFVNNDYPYNPPTKGVATLDVLDDTGAVYPHATFAPFPADHLTSQFIRLDSILAGNRALSPADSVYLSFFYQPQGYGNDPEEDDRLELQFLEAWRIDTIIDTITPPYDTLFIDIWNTVWSADGQNLESFYNQKGDTFEQVLIPIIDSIYFRKDFKFRFVNYGSLADNTLPSWQSNVDHWHIDYVYLNEKRHRNDLYRQDIALVNNAYSLLKTYDVLPYDQYSANPARHMGDSMYVQITNLDTATVNSIFFYDVRDDQGTVIYTHNGGNYNLDSYYTHGYQRIEQHAFPPVGFVYPSGSGDSASFTTTQVLAQDGSAGNIIKTNDTNRYVQQFRNYFAYDDGTAEAGYGLTPGGAKLAYQFIMDFPDTLTEIRMFFNRTAGAGNQQNFFLTVWKDNKGIPGEVIYAAEGKRPEFEGALNQFASYPLESEKPLIVGDTFYVGWVQETGDNLNVGFDRHRDASASIFYNTNNDRWMNSDFKGALMIRPVFGKYTAPTKGNPGGMEGAITLYPNPVSEGVLHFRLNQPLPEISRDGIIELYDLMGRHILTTAWQDQVFLPAGLRSGVYFLRIRTYSLPGGLSLRFVIP